MPGACSKTVQHDLFDQIFLDTKKLKRKKGWLTCCPFFLVCGAEAQNRMRAIVLYQHAMGKNDSSL